MTEARDRQDDTPTIDEIREWRCSRRVGGHSTDADLLALGRLVEQRWAMDSRRGARGGEEGT